MSCSITTIEGSYSPPTEHRCPFVPVKGNYDITHCVRKSNGASLPHLYEKVWITPNGNEDLSARIALFDTASKVDELFFSVTLMPTDPRKRQTWYLRKSAQIPLLETREFMHTYNTKEPMILSGASVRYVDFFQPFTFYDFEHISARSTQELPIVDLQSPADIDKSLEPLENSNQKESFSKILQYFLVDEGSKGIVLTFFSGKGLHNKYFMKNENLLNSFHGT